MSDAPVPALGLRSFLRRPFLLLAGLIWQFSPTSISGVTASGVLAKRSIVLRSTIEMYAGRNQQPAG
uniref:Uncharacterized protein n=1 Tax=Talaromyces marneffei PM1 TaxID=1077442 RepID=A0A093UMD2_TALMA